MYLYIPSILIAYLSIFFGFRRQLPLFYGKGKSAMIILAHAAAEIGVLFTALTIIEDSIWGRPTWGVGGPGTRV